MQVIDCEILILCIDTHLLCSWKGLESLTKFIVMNFIKVSAFAEIYLVNSSWMRIYHLK